MRNTQLEEKIVNKAFMFAGAGLLFGLMFLAIGTEMLILTYWDFEPIKFWIWQGVWTIVMSFIISGIARITQNG